ncbi:MAG: dipeptidase [Bacteroidales bacterium]|nr:dipeptidase [Bacteroidales bacterium]MCI5483415.1 dipeptidase [Bacteroidales bacterium]MDD6751919.1 dipeptidase [Bacteroidales bacterium]MDY2878794.1 dipeptidase [Candidatus Cryptobacteroides sp.]
MKSYIEQNQTRFLEELFSILRIQSVSAKSEHKADMYLCAEAIADLLIEAGADEAGVCETLGHPVVFGRKIIDPKARTVLIYGHYDVQPVEPLEKWNSDPFEPVVHDGAIWGRGANDDKGQLFMHIKAFEYLVSSGKLNCNVKFLFEGEEEIGSPSLPAWIKKHKRMLKADICLVSDTTMISDKVPSINCGMRGLSYLEVKLIGPNKDLHSGHYGGAVANPIQVLCEMISTLIDRDGRVTVPGFYDEVVELSPEERKMLARAPYNEREYKAFLDVKELRGEKGYTTLERTGIRPCLDVCGIWGGYTGEGAKTVLPSEAHAKISMRLVPNQKSSDITAKFARHFKSIAPKSVKVEVTAHEGGDGFLIPISSSAYKAASKAMYEVYGKKPVPSRGGGSIAVLAEVQKILGIDPLLMGFGLERDTIHSPNESFLLSQLFAGMESIALFYQYWKD